ncbi:hypothetical protein B0H66DRAFT_568763, partial [Apodospora peruviana]
MAPRDTSTNDKKTSSWKMGQDQPNPNGVIIRSTLENGYNAYTPSLVCIMTLTKNSVRGCMCAHRANARPDVWGCTSAWNRGASSPSARYALASPARHIRLAPSSSFLNGTTPSWWYPVAAHKKRKMREELVARPAADDAKKKRLPAAALRMRFARKQGTMGRDDPVEDGRDIAAGGDSLPSDRWQQAPSAQRTAEGLLLVSTEEKDVSELRKRGVMREEMEPFTLDSIVHEEPSYSVRIIWKKRKRGKGKGKSLFVGDADTTANEEKEGEEAVEEGKIEAALDTDSLTSEAVSKLEIDMPESARSCGDILANMEAEGWVPVSDEDWPLLPSRGRWLMT